MVSKSNAAVKIFASTASAICKNPVRHCFVFERVPSGAIAIKEPLSFSMLATASLTSPEPGLFLSTGIPPMYFKNLPKRGCLNKVYFPKKDILASKPIIAVKPKTPSQLDVCGAAMRTKFSLSFILGISPSIFQPNILSKNLARNCIVFGLCALKDFGILFA